MHLLYRYAQGLPWPDMAWPCCWAAINQVFSLLDPLIFRHVIDEYATKFEQYSHR
jgi:ATP-binding cassette subfamily B protein